MYKFRSLQLSNYLLWDEIEFNFQSGITHVHGLNKSGKSMLFATIPSILYDASPIPKNARATLAVDSDDHELDITVFNNSKARNRFEMMVDGKSQNTDKIDTGKNLIAQYFTNNIQQSLFDTTVRINGLGQHPLTEGKPATRLDWVHETLAYASMLDSYAEMVESKIKDVRDDSVAFKLITSEYEELEAVEKPERSPTVIKEALDDCLENIDRLTSEIRNIEKALEAPTQKEAPALSVDEASEKLEKNKKLVRRLSKARDQFNSYAESKQEYDKAIARRNKIKESYIALCKEHNTEVIKPKVRLARIDDIYDSLVEALQEMKARHKLYEEQTELRELAKGVCQWGSKKDYTDRLKDLHEVITINTRILRASKSGDKNCEMCGSDLRKHSKEHMTEVKNTLAKAKKRFESITAEYEVFKAKQTDFVKSSSKDIAKTEYAIAKCEALKEVIELYNEADARVPEKPTKVEFDKKEYKKAKANVEKYDAALVEAKTHEEFVDMMKKANKRNENNRYAGKPSAKLQKLLDKYTDERTEWYTRQKRFSDDLIQTQTQNALYIKHKERKKSLYEKRKVLHRSSTDHKLLLELRKALGRDGYRTKRLESTLELFVDNLNTLAPLIWNEPYKFEIETGPRKCNLIVHRNKTAGDALNLSGSENRCFQLLAAVAMLRLLPNNRRCDTIILDEVEAGMDEGARHDVMRNFIPEIQKTVPNVVVVSPLTRQALGLHPDQSYTVVKKNARSKLLTT